jgi:hypothetical protein
VLVFLSIEDLFAILRAEHLLDVLRAEHMPGVFSIVDLTVVLPRR